MVLKFESDSKRLDILSRRSKNTKAVKEFQGPSEGKSNGFDLFASMPPLACEVLPRFAALRTLCEWFGAM